MVMYPKLSKMHYDVSKFVHDIRDEHGTFVTKMKKEKMEMMNEDI